MNKDYILDYEQVLDKLKNLSKTTNIFKEVDIGTTRYGLPINCYSIGKGSKCVVVTGATHGSEIISTDFVLKLMENLSDGKESFLNDFKIYFIPMLNPEGYLITTSAIRAKIPRDLNVELQEKFAKEYYLAYKNDDIFEINRQKEGNKTDRNCIKNHQKLFEDVDASCIPIKYEKIKNKVSKIYEKYKDLPKGSIVTWSSNADGIDLQANSKYNPSINKIKNGEKIYKDNLRYSNINISHPGPINCPFNIEEGFRYTNEIIALNNFLEQLNKKNELYAYYNYHSTGGFIYQRPIKSDENEQEIKAKIIENYFFSKIYAGKSEDNYPSYQIKKGSDRRSTTNDSMRIMYPIDILVELSPMGGNPIGPYGDKEGNYRKTIKSNIKAFKSSMKIFEISKMLSKEMSISFSNLTDVMCDNIKNDKTFEKSTMDIYDIIDMIYDEFYKKIKKLENDKNNSNDLKKDENKNER